MKINKYRYNLLTTGYSSDKYGECEICGKHVSEVFHQIEEQQYNGGWTKYNCKDYFGHEECLKEQQKGAN